MPYVVCTASLMTMKLSLFANPTPEEYAMAPCPGCGQERILDQDQFFARVSTHCADITREDGTVLVQGCGFHETVNWSQR